MACVCETCLRHSKTLGVAQTPTSKSAIHKAYRSVAKLWHPDRFENNKQKRLEAEERFKQIHVAYQEMSEHFENPAKLPRDIEFVTPIRPQPRPTVFFGDAPGCFVAPHFPAHIQQMILASRLENSETAVGFIDMSAGGSRIARYILLTNHRMYIHDATGILSVVWYADLGEIKLIEIQAKKKPGAWQKIAERIAGKQQRYSVQINRLNGTRFHTLADQPDDSIKKVVYNFLRQMKSNSQA
jgi:hypothetical protein